MINQNSPNDEPFIVHSLFAGVIDSFIVATTDAILSIEF
jgi:hypothetical protein